MTAPARLNLASTDAHIFEVMTAWTVQGRPPLVRSRIEDGQRQAWSRTQERWLSVAEFAAEWRHSYRYKQIMGDAETCAAVTKYERSLGL